MTPNASGPGFVYLVGAGPGDPGLITWRGVECLRRADVVLYDYLVNPSIVHHARPSADLVRLSRTGPGEAFTPESITARMLHDAKAGKTVVRLKGGDPTVFGRISEEAEALREAGIPYEIVPGITTGLAVAAYTEIPVTHHDQASAVALIAGREREEKGSPTLDLPALARFPGTLVFYMGVGSVDEWSKALIQHGKDPTTPVAIVRWCSRPDQRTVRCTLESVTAVVTAEAITPPSVFVVGTVVALAPADSWFAARPLFGTHVLVPGSPATANKLSTSLQALGAEVTLSPAIEIGDPPDWPSVDEALDRMGQYDWLVFSSANGVDYLIKRLKQRGGDVRQFGGVKLAAMGSGTAERLASYSLRADLVPEDFVAESLARTLIEQSRSRTFLLARASRGRHVLAESLKSAGAQVDQVVVYSSVDVDRHDPEIAAMLSAGAISWVTVTSSATARSLAQLYGNRLGSARIASIGPITTATLRKLGFEPVVEASPATADGLVAAILGLSASE